MSHKQVLLFQIMKMHGSLRGRNTQEVRTEKRGHLLQYTGLFEKGISRLVVFEDLVDHVGKKAT